ncbi:MAG: permease [Candidatus Methanosuratus sp.]|nr:permease [Candidatus Methanosuratincola sp.]
MLEDQLISAGYWFAYISIELSVLFLGISFLIGLITVYVPPDKVERILSRYGKGLFGNVLGTAFGGLLPFCSCSTIPALIGLINIGVPFRIAMSFLIASPLGVFNLAVIGLFFVMRGPECALHPVYDCLALPRRLLDGHCPACPKTGGPDHAPHFRFSQSLRTLPGPEYEPLVLPGFAEPDQRIPASQELPHE